MLEITYHNLQQKPPIQQIMLTLALLAALLTIGLGIALVLMPQQQLETPLLEASQAYTRSAAVSAPLPAPHSRQVMHTLAPESETAVTSFAFAPIIMQGYNFVSCEGENSDLTTGIRASNGEPQEQTQVDIAGKRLKWHPLTLSFKGPLARETDESPNPFLDYRLQVQFLAPSGQSYTVPGYFAGDGNGNGDGDVWQVRFAPDEPGRWLYCASFRSGPDVAIDLDPQAGEESAFNGTIGVFEVGDLDPAAPGFLKWGRLDYVTDHYLKFQDGPYWLKGGTNSPENFLGYAGFDNTFDQGGIVADFLHEYEPHTQDWEPGDPNFANSDTGKDGKGIIGALNYLSEQHVNSIYFLPMNLGGDGKETYPFIAPERTRYNKTHYDISKLTQWGTVLDHAEEKGIAIHFVLNETEQENREWLDNGLLDIERKLFYRELIARYGHLHAIKWNLSEEAVFEHEQLLQFADYIEALDWNKHPITIHNPSEWFHLYENILGDARFSTTAMQYDGALAGELVETWRAKSQESGRPWVIDMDENQPGGIGLSSKNADKLRKQILYDVYFSGGNIEWYAGYYQLPVGGDVNLENFRTRESMWKYMWYARRFVQDNLPFWLMKPADDLLTGESSEYGGGEVFALDGVTYAVYLPSANPAGVLMVEAGKEYQLRWYNPKTGQFEGVTRNLVAGDQGLALGAPPSRVDGDWVALVTAVVDPAVSASEQVP